MLASIAAQYGLEARELVPYGATACKVVPGWLRADAATQAARAAAYRARDPATAGGLRYVVVTGVTPTARGEGKTTTALGLAMALGARCGRRAVCTLRQPSQGPTFGAKGGAHGGGRSRVADGVLLNLHCTGDTHAVVAAHNLVAAALAARAAHERATPSDARWLARLCPGGRLCPAQARRLQRLYGPRARSISSLDALTARERARFARLGVAPARATAEWPRVLDTSDGALRGRCEIAAASELMAVLALATSYADLAARVHRTVVAHGTRGAPVTVDDLGAADAVCALLRDALAPTLLASCERTPVLVHTGPFANIAHGCSSVVADWLAADMVTHSAPSSNSRPAPGYVVTEAGFGADIGFEKLCDIKTPVSGLAPDCAVLVATTRALRMHGRNSTSNNNNSNSNSNNSTTETEEVARGAATNLRHHIDLVARGFGVPVVVALNCAAGDTRASLAAARREALRAGAAACVACTHHQHGSAGAVALARAVEAVCDSSRSAGRSTFRPLYRADAPLHAKLDAVARRAYGAGRVRLTRAAAAQLRALEADPTTARLPVCVAKTALSVTAAARVKGAPRGFALPVDALRARHGAGFVTAHAGTVTTMPALPSRPAFFDVRFDPRTGRIDGIAD